ncbi:Glutathione S-transferase [Blomia tropicalis]|nr:Glutathione S-transferase [Blomia tropicalis]
MAIDLYRSILSPLARSVTTLAKHLGFEVNIKELNMMAGEHKSPEFLKGLSGFFFSKLSS